MGLGADAVHRAVHHRLAEDVVHGVLQVLRGGEVDGLAAVLAHQLQPRGVLVAHDDARGAQQPSGGRGAPAHGAGTGDVDGGAGLGAGLHEAVERRREDVREHGQIQDLLHRLLLVREAQQLEVGVRHEQVLGLPALEAAQIEAVGGAGLVRVGGLADLGPAGAAVAATAAGHVERHGDEVALLQELDVAADLQHLAGHLVTQHHALGRGEGPAVDVQVAAADVGRDDLEDDAVRGGGAVGHLQLGEVELVDAHVLDAVECHGAVLGGHGNCCLSVSSEAPTGRETGRTRGGVPVPGCIETLGAGGSPGKGSPAAARRTAWPRPSCGRRGVTGPGRIGQTCARTAGSTPWRERTRQASRTAGSVGRVIRLRRTYTTAEAARPT